ncbi:MULTISPECIES: hypothetical protein [Rhizobium]|uniref:hypothetical protein n=1 Tax=Rhizobium TaxID=379 RepID=UPI0011471686|nr:MULTISPECIES: hypothetical protein [Rhizobium]NTF40921.1 hypothetical protein [Rhizobium rhizogenes]
MRTASAERNVQTVRLGTAFGIGASAMSPHDGFVVSQNAYRRSFAVISETFSRDTNDNLESAGLILMGYPDTSGAPSANLRR